MQFERQDANMSSIGSKGLLGGLLMIIGVVGLLPAISGSAPFFQYLLAPAVLLLAIGTLIVGTQGPGPAV